MPTYSYACKDCDYRFDIQQAFTDDALDTCPRCGGTLRKVFSAVGVVFKGSGFYRTDSRSGSGSGSVPGGRSSSTDAGKAAASTGSGSSEGGSGSSESSSKSSSSGSSGSGSSESSSKPSGTTTKPAPSGSKPA